MEPHEHIDQLDMKESKRRKRRTASFVLNVAIVALLLIVGYFSYAFMTKNTTPSADEKAQTNPPKVIQLDVLNGCRIRRAAARVTSYMRAHGFDVVEMKNYKTNNMRQTVVVDRIGDLASARRVAQALGVSEKNVIQQINPDYFVDVSVIIGEDFSSLKLSN